MPAIKTFFQVTNPLSAFEDKQGKVGECIEYCTGWIRLKFDDGKTRTYFHGEVEEVGLPAVERI